MALLSIERPRRLVARARERFADWRFDRQCELPKPDRRLPRSLSKAMGDPFDYALRLRTGEIICFYSADWDGGAYVHLRFRDNAVGEDDAWANAADHNQEYPPFRFARGVDVCLSDIVWCADAPNGS